jgi:hypothetical protein
LPKTETTSAPFRIPWPPGFLPHPGAGTLGLDRVNGNTGEARFPIRWNGLEAA